MEISFKFAKLTILRIVLIGLLLLASSASLASTSTTSTTAMKRTRAFLKRYPLQRNINSSSQLSLPVPLAFSHRFPRIHFKMIRNKVTPLQHPQSSSFFVPMHVTKRDKSTFTYEDVINMDDGQLAPMAVVSNGTLPMPKALSPSAAAEFKNCPQSFLFQYILSIKQPPNLALAKGSMCHSALEQIFDLEPQDRTLSHLQNLFRKNWSAVRLSDAYGPLFEKSIQNTHHDDVDDDNSNNNNFEEVAVDHERDIDAERTWGNEALDLLSNYYQLEDPRLIPKPNPLEREMWVTANLTLDPNKGATSNIMDYASSTSINNHDKDKPSEDDETFLVRGIVDRLDYVAVPPLPQHVHSDANSSDDTQVGAVRIVDYKTGKAPDFKYSPSTNQRIAEDNLWQLKIYALLLIEMIKNDKAYSKSGNLQKLSTGDIRLLRLMYLTSVDGEAKYLDMDLGSTQDERNQILHKVHEELSDIWKNIQHLVSLQDPKAFKHCDRPWCYCHKIRPKFIPDSLNQ